MTLTITPTDQFATIGGAKCRVWLGRTEQGNPCYVYTAGVSCGEHDAETLEELKTALTLNPNGNVEASAAIAELVRRFASDGGLD